MSEAQALRRVEQAVQQCRADLQDLRTIAKAAISHREKCAALLSAATTAVLALEDMLYSPDLDVRREKALQQLCVRVQAALDQSEAIVKVYGSMNGMAKLTAKIFSPAPAKFEAATGELAGLAKQGQLLLQQPGSAALLGGSANSSSVLAADEAPGGGKTRDSSSNGQQQQQVPEKAGGSEVQDYDEPGQHPPSLRSMAAAGTSGGGSGRRSFYMRDQETPIEALQPSKVFRGGHGQLVSALLYVPPRMDQLGRMGRLWFYISRRFTGDSLLVHDLSNGVSQEVKEARGTSVVTCMHLDDTRGLVWTGHRNGNVRVWEEASRAPLCDASRAFHKHIMAITTDESGCAWAGDKEGKVKSLRVAPVTSDGLVLAHALKVRGALKRSTVPASHAETRAVLGEGGMVEDPLATRNAHEGMVTAIAAAVGRVWTSGGDSAFVCLKEWTQQGEFIGESDLKSMGAANQMVITSPLVRICVASPVAAVAAGTGSVLSTRSTAATSEVPQAWQLLTAHNSGIVQVWAMISGMLRPVLRIGERTSPAKGIVICEQLGVLCTAHTDGRLLVRSLPHPKSAQGLTVDNYAPGKVNKVNLDYGEQRASTSGLALVDGGLVGVVTASTSASVKLWPEAELRAIAVAHGLSLQSEQSPREQWPLLLYKSSNLQKAISGLEGPDAARLAAGLAGLARADESSGVLFGGGGGAASWLIDFKDLACSTVIGEGAFGKVFLGRWQETDVAIKMLGSLQALGLAAGSVQHDEGGGVKLGADVQRQLEREVGLMVAMRHPCIILFMGVCLEPACVVTEYCSRGSLYDLLKQARGSPALAKQLDWPKRLSMALDAAKGMLYLHSHKPSIIHRDLKSPNLLVDKHWRAKVTDFNLSRLTEGPSVASSSVVANNPRWQAPEVIAHQDFSKASDVYAFGLIMWELLTWALPFEQSSSYQIMMAVAERGERPPVPDVYETARLPGGSFLLHDEWVLLMQDCWAQEPEERPTFEAVIARLRSMAEEYVRQQSGGAAVAAAAAVAGAPAIPPGPVPDAAAAAQEVKPLVAARPSPFDSAPLPFGTHTLASGGRRSERTELIDSVTESSGGVVAGRSSGHGSASV